MSSPHRYPFTPNTGMKKNTPLILIPRLIVLMRKERVVLPIPFIILIRVVFVYKNGHIHANVTIKSPARRLVNR